MKGSTNERTEEGRDAHKMMDDGRLGGGTEIVRDDREGRMARREG